jgi:phage baseplate assembly protein gpV
MATSFVEQAANTDEPKSHSYSIACATVTNNVNLLLEGKVLVHIPTLPAADVWARMVSVGGGSGRGFMWLPQINDEVLVAFNENDERDVYVLGGLWNTLDRPPAIIPTDFVTKRILKTGLTSALGHEIEFDDALQSIKITSSTKQEITIDPTKISVSTTGGAMSVTLNLAGTPPGITIQSTVGNISLSAPLGKISIQGLAVEVISTTTLDLKSTGPCTIAGLPVKIN